MRAAVLKSFGSPLNVEEVPDPGLGTGEVIVDVAAAGMLAYAGEVYSGARGYLMKLPMVPGSGAIGRIRATGPDATRLRAGDWVFCDPTVRSRDGGSAPDIILQGLTGATESALPLQAYFHDGAFAAQMRVPTENVTPIGPISPDQAPLWTRLSTLLVPFGGLLAIDLKPGEVTVINGATGRFGGAAVEVALAMGAARVVAVGRNGEVLDRLASRLGSRVRITAVTGEEQADGAAILAAAGGPPDVVFDILPPAAVPQQVRAAILTVRPNGRVVLMGGVGMTGGPGLELPYPWLMRNNVTVRGQWMYPREAVPRMVGMIRSGLLDLTNSSVTTFELAAVNDAVAHAAANAGPFAATVVCP